ncbi:hypothetical protein ACI797_11725 [Geodermatophilus sp. SYSU D00691]
MTAPGTDPDGRLVDDLRAALRGAGTPTPTMVAAAEAAFAWRTVDAELVALTHDSVAEERALVRGTVSGPRSLVFEGARLSVELEHTDEGLIGQIIPAVVGDVTALAPDGELGRDEVDELGCFRFDGRFAGLVRLRCRTQNGTVVTDWVRL